MRAREPKTSDLKESEAVINAATASAFVPANAPAWVAAMHRVHNYVLQDLVAARGRGSWHG
jgi:hypothetical protein